MDNQKIIAEKLDTLNRSITPLFDKLYGKIDTQWPTLRSDYMNTLSFLFPPLDEVSFEEVDMDGVPGIVAIPPKIVDERKMLYMHGGGYVHGGVNGYKGLLARYATLLNAEVFAPDYRQAPEVEFPIPIQDVFTSYKYLINSGADPKTLTITGDSAGGAMVVTLMRWMRDHQIPLPVAGVAISPWADLSHEYDPNNGRSDDEAKVALGFLNKLAKVFLGNTSPKHPDASPVYADVQGLSPILIQAGEADVMLSEAVDLAGRLAESRVRVTLEVWPEMIHVWHHFFGVMPEANEAVKNSADFLLRELERAKR